MRKTKPWLNISGLFLFAGFSLGISSASAADSSFDLKLLGDFYLSKEQKDQSNGQIHGRFKYFTYLDRLETYLDLGANGLLADETDTVVYLPQAFVKYKFGAQEGMYNKSLEAGRVVKAFSFLDEHWHLGEIQPLLRWDALKPETQGLTGLFLNLESPNVDFTLFASGITLPTQGPSFKVRNGKITSGNPWFSEPIDQLSASNTVFDLNYNINIPDISDLILKLSYGAHIKLKSANEKFWLQGSYFNKYRNELALPFIPTLNIATNVGTVDVYARMVEHKTYSADAGYQGDKVGFVLSGLWEQDLGYDRDDVNWFSPVFSNQYKVAATLLLEIHPRHKMSLSWLNTQENEVGVVSGVTVLDSLDAYQFRNQYNNGVRVELSSLFSSQPYGFLWKTRAMVIHDYEAEATLVSVSAEYQPLAQLSVFGRFDFFGESNVGDVDYRDTVSQYQVNDRGQVGVRYVF